MKNNYLVQAWLVLTLALCFGAALAGIEVGLGPKIKQNRLDETLRAIPKLVNGAVAGERAQVGGKRVYRAMNDAGAQVGWVVPAEGQGFADTIRLLVGLNADATRITGIYVLDQKETPGLGNKIVNPAFRGQFEGIPAGDPLEVTKAEATRGQVEAVTGATISSQAVTDIVNKVITGVRAELAGAGEGEE